MKLIRPPVGTYKKIELRHFAYVYPDEFGPSFSAGAIQYGDCVIDFGGRHTEACVMHSLFMGSSIFDPVQKMDITIDDYEIFGAVPMENMGGTVWRCSISSFKKRQ